MGVQSAPIPKSVLLWDEFREDVTLFKEYRREAIYLHESIFMGEHYRR